MFKALEFQAILKRGGGGGRGARKSVNRKLPSICLLDAVTIHWLLAIDKRLISIVKTELATDLKSKRMCQLVKQIAPNIDEWLARYNQGDTINSVQAQQAQPATNIDPSIAAIVQRLDKLETGARQRSWRGRNNNRLTRNTRPTPTCGHCSYTVTEV